MEKNYILHLGLGSFHRAHQAVYLNKLHEMGDKSWAYLGANIREFPNLKPLADVQGKYILETVTPMGKRTYQEINSIERVIEFEPQLSEVLEIGGNESTKIISFTVTEAGYSLDSDNHLEMNQEIKDDVEKSKKDMMGQTIYGALYPILLKRQAKSLPLTLMNCDNLRHNGDRFKSGMEQYMKAVGNEELISWFQTNITCPNGMVDRITPRPTESVVERVKEATGKDDPNALMAEEFIQWVLEDRFIAGRPALEKVDVEMVEDVQPYEEAKIRLLNATHSCVAWAGTLLGYTYIHEGTLDEKVRELAYRYITDDVIPVLSPSPVNLEKYRDVVLDRFSNPDLQDTNQRVAMDGFSKIPGFITPTIRERIKRKESVSSVMVLPALFLLFLQKWDRGELDYQYEDQVMVESEAKAICQTDDPVALFVQHKGLWGDLANHEIMNSSLHEAIKKIKEHLNL